MPRTNVGCWLAPAGRLHGGVEHSRAGAILPGPERGEWKGSCSA